jgi:hypothetical protein
MVSLLCPWRSWGLLRSSSWWGRVHGRGKDLNYQFAVVTRIAGYFPSFQHRSTRA